MLRIKRRKIFVLKKWVRVLLFLMLLSLATLSCFLIHDGIKPIVKKDAYYFYNIKRDVDYKVYLKPNNFYEEKFIEKGRQYNTALIDYIDVDFLFNYSDSVRTNYDYSYSIEGKLVGEYNDSVNGKQELWTKNYTFVDKVSKKSEGMEFTINENLKLYYDQFNKVVEDFKTNFKLAIDSYLEVTLKVNYQSKLKNNDVAIEDKDELKIVIPLSRAAINIDTNFKENESDSLSEEVKFYNYKKIYIGVILIILVIIAFAYLKNMIFVDNKTIYRKKLDKILKDFSEIIITTTTPINYDGMTIYEITDFDDMIDIEEELNLPIMLYEVLPGRVSHFVVIKDNTVYRYILDISKVEL